MGILGILALAPAYGAGATYTVAARNLSISGGTKPGDAQTLSFKLETKGSGARDVVWIVYCDGQTVVKSDSRKNVPAGASLDTSTVWTAVAGQHTFHAEVDPKNTLLETASERVDNKTPVATKVFADWPRWTQSAMEGCAGAVNLWSGSAVLSDVRIDGAMAWGGVVNGTFTDALVTDSMIRAGAPADLSRNLATSLREAWMQWQASLRVPGLPWYPSFASYAGATVVPTPNIPTPLASLTQNTADLTANALATRIRSKIGAAKDWPEGAQQIEKLCAWFNAKFTTMLGGGVVRNVIATGSVPSYSPPAVTSGPVRGTGTMKPGGFQCFW